MPKIQLTVYTIAQHVGETYAHAEVLGFHEFSRVGSRKQLVQQLQSQVEELIQHLPGGELYRRTLPTFPEIGSIKVDIPPSDEDGWRDALSLAFPYVTWPHDGETVVAVVPSLHLYVVGNSRAAMRGLIRDEIHFALSRVEPKLTLRDLVRLQQCDDLTVSESQLSVEIAGPKEAALREKEQANAAKSALEETADDLGKQWLPKAYEVDEPVARLAEALSGSESSVLLVGPSGVGKTAILHELIRRRADFHLDQHQFWETSGSRLVAGMSGFGMWQERCERLVKEVNGTTTVLCIGHLLEWINVGQSTCNQQSIGAFLAPYFVRRQLNAVAECLPEQLAILERTAPQLLNAFQILRIEEPTADQGRAILLSDALEVTAVSHRPSRQDGESNPATPIDAEALEMIDRLHRRYAAYSAYPGRPLRFLRNLLSDGPRDRSLTALDVTDRFAQETGLPDFLLRDDIRLDLDETRKWFRQRLIGQEQVIDLIVDTLATVKAGLTRTGRPIASLLFIGPTGVGKTEMAKLLAEFLYRSRDRMIRIDMSEYADTLAIERLIGGTTGEGLLTSRVREQPFSVVLLDEFEKAHPAFFDLLLQVLGEGRLTDGSGRLASFCNSVVIMTSNLGVDSFRPQSLGFGEHGVVAEDHFTAQVQQHLRPELFNRIDRIAAFHALSLADIQQIATREVELISQRDGIKYRGVSLNIEPQLLERIAHAGYDPRYGARPLQRAIERHLLAGVADRLNQYSGDTALDVTATYQVETPGDSVKIATQAKLDGAGRKVQAWRSSENGEDTEPALTSANRTTELRRQTQQLDRCSRTLQMRNDIFRVEQLQARMKKGRRQARVDPRWTTELSRLANWMKADRAIAQLAHDAVQLEEEALLGLYGEMTCHWNEIEDRCQHLEAQLRESLLTMYLLDSPSQNAITLIVFGEKRHRNLALARSYFESVQGRVSRCRFYHLKPYREATDISQRDGQTDDGRFPAFHLKHRPEGTDGVQSKSVDVFPVEDTVRFWGETPRGVIGLAMELQGEQVYPLLASEEGAHEFRAEEHREFSLVETTSQPLREYEPPSRVERAGGISGHTVRRRYTWNHQLDVWEAVDPSLPTAAPFRGAQIAVVVRHWVDACFEQAIRSVLDD